MTRPDCIPADYWNTLPAELRPGLLAIIAVFDARIADLESKLRQNSSNSSRPPSSDLPQLKRGVPRPPAGDNAVGRKVIPRPSAPSCYPMKSSIIGRRNVLTAGPL